LSLPDWRKRDIIRRALWLKKQIEVKNAPRWPVEPKLQLRIRAEGKERWSVVVGADGGSFDILDEASGRTICAGNLSSVGDDRVMMIVDYGWAGGVVRGWNNIGNLKLWRLKWTHWWEFGANRFKARGIRLIENEYQMLERLVELSHLNPESGLGSANVANGLDDSALERYVYGERFHLVENYDTAMRRHMLIVRSLANRGGLVYSGSKIIIGPRAMEIISDYAIAERRHRDLRNVQRLLAILTAVLAIASIAPWFFGSP
jgi:hypothetical protein